MLPAAQPWMNAILNTTKQNFSITDVLVPPHLTLLSTSEYLNAQCSPVISRAPLHRNNCVQSDCSLMELFTALLALVRWRY